MRERCIFPDYELRGREYEVWTNGHCNPGEYPQWWLAGGHKPGWILDEDDFDPKLTAEEIRKISEAVYDYLVGD